MTIDLRDTETQFDRTPIPSGVYHLKIAVKPGGIGPGGFLRLAKNLRSSMLELECTVVGGEYAGRKVWDFITLEFDENNRDDVLPVETDKLEKFRTSVRMGRTKLRAVLDSAFGLHPNDHTEATDAKRQLESYGDLNGLTFYAQVESKPGGSGYGPRNSIDFIITCDLPDWPAKPAQAVVPFQQTLTKEMDDEIPF
jgi:hypothetical protein